MGESKSGFTIFTHVDHANVYDQYFAYPPYIREMNLWLRHVERVEVIAPVGETKAGEPYQHGTLGFTAIPSFNLLSFRRTLIALYHLPLVLYKLTNAMRRANHVHLRCPGNIGLLASIVQIFFPKKSKTAKYAGNWDPQAKQPWTYRLQKWILSNTFLTRNMQVLVYGEWPGKSKNIIPFFTASFSEEEKTEVREKSFSEPFIFLFVGNLVEGKRPLQAVKLVEAINQGDVQGADQDSRAKLEIYGDGPERERLETYVRGNRLDRFITLKGSRPLEELKEAYQNAHFVILPSRSEGWPKAVAEGMFFGCIPIATSVSCVPWMLDYGKRGILLADPEKEDRDKKLSVGGYQLSKEVEKIKNLLKNPHGMKKMSLEAKEWSQQYTLERFEEALKEVLNKEQRTTNNKRQTLQ